MNMKQEKITLKRDFNCKDDTDYDTAISAAEFVLPIFLILLVLQSMFATFDHTDMMITDQTQIRSVSRMVVYNNRFPPVRWPFSPTYRAITRLLLPDLV